MAEHFTKMHNAIKSAQNKIMFHLKLFTTYERRLHSHMYTQRFLLFTLHLR